MQQKKPIDWEKDYKFLEEKLTMCSPDYQDQTALDVLETLRQGEEAFFWKSPLAASAEEAVDMARRATEILAPAPGREITTAVIYIITDAETNFDTINLISDIIQQMVTEDGPALFGVNMEGEKGICLVVATAESRVDENELHHD